MKTKASKRKLNGEFKPGADTENTICQDIGDRLIHIATAAYYKAEARGFLPGKELDDWLDAEATFAGMESR